MPATCPVLWARAISFRAIQTPRRDFPFTVKAAGRYEVRVAWQPHENRAKAAPVTVRSLDGEKTIILNQTEPARGANGFESLGEFRFAANEKAVVQFRVAGAKGLVHIDAVQIVPAK